jgi:prefoldin subunit 5
MMTSDTIGQRLEALRAEYEKGQRQLELVERQRQEFRDTLLRISGAIQVLEELQRGTPIESNNHNPAS